MSGREWIGVDLDRTLAFYDHWRGEEHIGAPILPMLHRVKQWLAQGEDVRILTARVSFEGTIESKAQAARARAAIVAWCLEHIGQELPVTCVKDYAMKVLYDDRARQVIANTGIIVPEHVTSRPASPAVWVWFTVPAGAPPHHCGRCGVPVFWIPIPQMPVSVPVDCHAIEGSVVPSRPHDPASDIDPVPWNGRGVSHHLTCMGTRARAVPI